MKWTLFLFAFICFSNELSAQQYTPASENLKARENFQDKKFGLFIHWGISSELGAGEWVMNNRNIKVDDYKKLVNAFYPHDFDAAKWVTMAKDAGMKYITFITRHHDGFSLWDTKYSDYNIMNTPYGKDVLKMLSEECKKQGITLNLYYSLLDWARDDYPYQTGRTGHGTGRTAQSNYAHYLRFMKDQLTELLTNYGPIGQIWFDGHWDQTDVEGAHDLTSRLDWKYDEIYGLIHRLQPACMIGNNHHQTPFPGEDFQMFERDLPGENKSGLSFQQASHLPLETCETLNDSWGYNITDRHYKSRDEVIRLLVNAAGRNANLLLNVGPRPDGNINQQFIDTLNAVGEWLRENGKSIYGTRGEYVQPQPWGVVTGKDNIRYVHILQMPSASTIFIPQYIEKIRSCKLMNSNHQIKFKQQPEGVFIYLNGIPANRVDVIIEMEIKS